MYKRQFVKRGTVGARRAENKEKARLRAQAMAKARIEAKKKAAEIANEEITPYDMVLEYLLSTEQVATIEEANYVMTEMDAETIQSVVKEFMGGKPGDGYIGHPRLKIKNPLNPPKKETKKTTGKGSEKGVQGLGNRATEIEDMNTYATLPNQTLNYTMMAADGNVGAPSARRPSAS